MVMVHRHLLPDWMYHRCLLLTLATVTLLAPCQSQPALSEQITFKILGLSTLSGQQPQELRGRILMKTMSLSYFAAYDIPPSPPVEVSCAAGTYFKAVVSDEYAPIDSTSIEQPCRAGTMAFYFKRKAYADFIVAAKSGQALQDFASNGALMQWQTELATALQNQDTEKTLKTSSEIYNYLANKGHPTKAEPYRVLNFDVAKSKLTGAGELTFDPVQKRYVLGPNDIDRLTKFQKKFEIDPTGQVDWPTMHLLATVPDHQS